DEQRGHVEVVGVLIRERRADVAPVVRERRRNLLLGRDHDLSFVADQLEQGFEAVDGKQLGDVRARLLALPREAVEVVEAVDRAVRSSPAHSSRSISSPTRSVNDCGRSAGSGTFSDSATALTTTTGPALLISPAERVLAPAGSLAGAGSAGARLAAAAGASSES